LWDHKDENFHSSNVEEFYLHVGTEAGIALMIFHLIPYLLYILKDPNGVPEETLTLSRLKQCREILAIG
jgi:hypothetical protein